MILAHHVDDCAWLPREGGGGWILARGWAHANERPNSRQLTAVAPLTQVALEFRAAGRRHRTKHVATAELRPDVVAVHPGAPDCCGFDLQVPCGTPLDDRKVRFSFRRSPPLGRSADTDVEIRDFGDPEGLAELGQLDPALRVKLRNLLLNESERLAGTIEKRSRPISLYIEPSFACNLDCPHCTSHLLRITRFGRKPLEQELLDEILAVHGETLIRVTFAMWGEPLLHRKLATIIRKVKAHRVFTELSSNMSVPLSEAAVQALVLSGLDEMRLSIDGATQPVYERYRVGGSLGLVLANVRRLVATKKAHGLRTPRLRWQYLRFPWNAHEEEAARTLAESIGVDEFYAFPGDLWSGTRDPRARVDGDEHTPVDPDLQQSVAVARETRRGSYRHAGCDFLDHTLAINSDGVIHPCCYVVEPKNAVGAWDGAPGEDHFNLPLVKRLRRFVAEVGPGTFEGPAPCAACGALSAAYVPDHLSFWSALQLIESRDWS